MYFARYYVAEGVRLHSQETWRQVAGSEGKALVEKYIDPVVGSYTVTLFSFVYVVYKNHRKNVRYTQVDH